ncbi:MAG: alkylhydroperoxidase-related (seleno)protein, partial [Pseudomonadota bacterium]|nr:alkylhydroperoxidase-related (seleno)protein [Pseudomonadota bacterium]
MFEIDYKSSNYEIRADLEAAHQRAWAALAKPGTWLTGAERIAVARETRHAPDCELCQRQNAALSPSAVEGTHDSVTALPAAYVEIIHRVTNDPTRLSKSWFEGV